MKDRFKFRIFDKNQKKMVELDAVGYSSFDPFGKGISRLIMIPSGLNNTFSYNKQALYENDNFTEPMQCTGLKDKRGKLIYEGDIVSVKVEIQDFFGDDEYYSETYKGKIIYDKGEIVIDVVDTTKHTISLYRHAKNCEIVGNIYENQELLKEVKWWRKKN